MLIYGNKCTSFLIRLATFAPIYELYGNGYYAQNAHGKRLAFCKRHLRLLYPPHDSGVLFTLRQHRRTKNYIPVGDPVYRSFIIETPEGAPCGFCYFARFKPREAFRISVELTLYLKPEFTGRGYGKQAILRLEEIIRQEGFSNIMALISGENEASIRLFEKCGFECCANIRQVAEKFGKKLDLKMYQKIISDNSHLTP